MKTLVTGGAGFIGSYVVDLLVERGTSVVVLDSLVSQVHGPNPVRPSYLNPKAELIVGDVEDPKAVARALSDVGSVIHLAAAVGVGQSMYEIVPYTRANVMATAVLLQALVDRKQKLNSLIVASSMSCYGEGRYRNRRGELATPGLRPEAQLASGQWEVLDEDGGVLEPIPTDEAKPLQPSSVYAIGKRDQEEMCLSVGSAYDIPTMALRFFNAYGPRQALSNPYTGVAAIFCSRLLNNRPPLVFEDGRQRRDFVHVRDLARAVVQASERPVSGQVANIGSGQPLTVQQVAEVLAKQMNKAIAPEVAGKFRKGDIRHCFADISRARRLLNWRPEIQFSEGVGDLVEWVSSQAAVDHVDSALSDLKRRGLIQ